MTRYTIYPNANDHWVRCSNATYSTARNGTGTLSNTAGGNTANVEHELNAGTTYRVGQLFMEFDTSAVPAFTPSQNVTLSMYLYVISSFGTNRLDVAETTVSGGTGDFIAGTALSGKTAFGNRSYADTDGGWYTITGPANVTRTATYGLVKYHHDQQLGNAPPLSGVYQFRAVGYTGTTYDPYLTIVYVNAYSITAAGGSFALSGQAAALRPGKKVVAAAGSFSLAGQAAAFRCARTVLAAAGIFALAGQAARTLLAAKVVAAYGAFSLTGIAATMGIKRYPPIGRTITFKSNSLEGRTLEL